MSRGTRRIVKPEFSGPDQWRECLKSEYREFEVNIEDLQNAYCHQVKDEGRDKVPDDFLNIAQECVRDYNHILFDLTQSEKLSDVLAKLKSASKAVSLAADALADAEFRRLVDLAQATIVYEDVEAWQKDEKEMPLIIAAAKCSLELAQSRLDYYLQQFDQRKHTNNFIVAINDRKANAYQEVARSAIYHMDRLGLSITAGTEALASRAERLLHAFLPRTIGGDVMETAEAFRRVKKKAMRKRRSDNAQQNA